MGKTHLCTKCGKGERVGTKQWCNPCSQEYERNRWNGLPEWKRRAKWLKSKYGLSYEQYEQMYNDQNGKCKTCSTDISIEAKKNGHETACVDHCHSTGKIRGLLCNHCNRAIGLLKENINTLNNIMNYLKGNT